jgi:hypothetical protein
MTETVKPETGAGQGQEENRPRCQAGRATKGSWCWREATERITPESPVPNVCAEHYRAIQLSCEVDTYFDALDDLREWIAAKVDSEYENRLMNHAYRMRDDLEREYWRAAVKDRAASLIANLGPGERITDEAAEEFAEVALRADALADARGTLEDAPEEVFGRRDRWQIVAGLAASVEAVNEEHDRCKQRIGL